MTTELHPLVQVAAMVIGPTGGAYLGVWIHQRFTSARLDKVERSIEPLPGLIERVSNNTAEIHSLRDSRHEHANHIQALMGADHLLEHRVGQLEATR